MQGLIQAMIMAGMFAAPGVQAQATFAGQQQACRARMAAIAPADPRLKQLEEVYDRHVHLGASVHNMLPHYMADFDDLLNIRHALSESDIPYLVYQVVNGTVAGRYRRVAIGVVPLFQAAALPCIEAAMESAPAARVTLRQMKSIIKINQQ